MSIIRRRVVIAVVGLLVAGLAAAAYASLRGEPLVWNKPAEASADGTRLFLVATGGACADRTTVDVEESPDRVEVTIRQLSLADACSDVGVPVTVVAELDEPLGGRDLIDGACADREQPRRCRIEAPMLVQRQSGS